MVSSFQLLKNIAALPQVAGDSATGEVPPPFSPVAQQYDPFDDPLKPVYAYKPARRGTIASNTESTDYIIAQIRKLGARRAKISLILHHTCLVLTAALIAVGLAHVGLSNITAALSACTGGC